MVVNEDTPDFGMSGGWRLKVRTIRFRVLAIALIPAVALLVVGVGAAGYLVSQGISAQTWSSRVEQAIGPGIQFTSQVAEERRLSLLRLGGDTGDSAALPQQRELVNATLPKVDSLASALTEVNPTGMRGMTDAFGQLVAQLPAIRAQVDNRQATQAQVMQYYGGLISRVETGLQGLAATAPDAAAAAAESTAAQLFQVVDAMSTSNALAAGAVAGSGLSADEVREYAAQVGAYHVQIQALQPQLTADEQSTLTALTNGNAWKNLTAMENALIQRGTSGTGTGGLPFDIADWQAAAGTVSTGLTGIWSAQHQHADTLANNAGRDTLLNSVFGGVAVLVIAIAALLIAARIANRLITRLQRLRADALELAEERLPIIVERLRVGEQVDIDTELPTLAHGPDEIGQVAEAFNKAQHTAVRAAVEEAASREGFNAVFLNIAHRSQVVVHRQLAVLDQAERELEDPDQLALLFQLDHLATRARRNAENLIILGGEQPGRQWRNPVPLVEIVRSAVAETENYARVHTTRLPDVSMVGAVVADLVHLLAELVDNATTFSPPDSRVEIHGNVVGKGIVIEVEDQGLGIPDEERERLNTALHDPPDFGVMSLSKDSRLGLFVVGQLAVRQGISVTLAESVYGGIRAIVLVRSMLIASGDKDSTNGKTGTNGTNGTARPGRSTDPAEDIFRDTTPVADEAEQTTELPRQREFASAAAVQWPVEEPPPIPTQAPGPARARRQTTAPQVVVTPDEDRPPLPRRRRQANLSPQLISEATPPAEETVVIDGGTEPRSAEHARDAMSAFQRGTRRGRDAQ
jgi:signal transduction histidine kinase